jgi:hypothetical protein
MRPLWVISGHVGLVDTIERGLDNAGIITLLDLIFQPVAFWAAGDFNERGQPVERRERGAEPTPRSSSTISTGPLSCRRG